MPLWSHDLAEVRELAQSLGAGEVVAAAVVSAAVADAAGAGGGAGSAMTSATRLVEVLARK